MHQEEALDLSVLQQTLQVVRWGDSDKTLHARDLLFMTPDDFAELRRAATKNRLRRRRGEDLSPLLRCGLCHEPAYLTWLIRRDGIENRHFRHGKESGLLPPDQRCPWSEGAVIPENRQRAIVFAGCLESQAHKDAKEALKCALELDPDVSNIQVERTVFSAIAHGERKRPDVRCTWRGKTIVFEVQLSHTFITDTVDREAFYQREGEFLIWVYREPDASRSFVRDEYFSNRRNLFVLTAGTQEGGLKQSRLILECRHEVPLLDEDRQLQTTYRTTHVGLADLVFPEETFRPYFFDYKSAARALLKPPAPVPAASLPDDFREAFLVALRCPPLSGQDRDTAQLIHHRAIEKLPDPGLREIFTRVIGESLRHMLRLLSFQDRKVWVSKQKAPFSLLADSIQSTSRYQVGYHILLCEGWLHWKPSSENSQHAKALSHLEAARSLLSSGHHAYRPPLDFVVATAVVFPELIPAMARISGLLSKYLDGTQWETSEGIRASHDLAAKAGVAHQSKWPSIKWRELWVSARALARDNHNLTEALLLSIRDFQASPERITNFWRASGLLRRAHNGVQSVS